MSTESHKYDPLEMQFDGNPNSQRIANRLRFFKWYFQKHPEDHNEPKKQKKTRRK